MFGENERPVVTLAVLAAAVPGSCLVGEGATPVREVVFNSTEVRPGYLFAALVGGYVDGHRFAADAVARGAAALLVERDLPLAVPQLIVTDSRAALASVAAAFHGRPSERLHVIGITGTDGKTTTSYLTDAILRRAGFSTGVVGTVSVQIAGEIDTHGTRQTTPESAEVQRILARMVARGVEWAILEATSHGLDLHRLDEVRFQIAAVTNITHEHLEHHKTLAAYRRAKAILFERVAAVGGVAVVNLDDEGARSVLPYAGETRLIGYSLAGADGAALRAGDVVSGAGGSRFHLAWEGQQVHVDLPLVGEFNVANALCAAGVALGAGVPLAMTAAALAAAPQIPGRMARVDLGQPFSVVVDYAHTPDSLEKVLRLLRRLTPAGRLIAVTGSAGERDVAKRPLQGGVCARLADYSVFTSEDPRFEDPEAIIAQIAAGAALAGGDVGRTYDTVTDRRAAIRRALAAARSGDCVLLAGKGHEGSIIWGAEKRPWDEAGVAAEVLREMGLARRD